MRTVLGCVAAAALVIGGGCGGGDDAPDGLARAELTKRADAICAKATDEVARVKPLDEASGSKELTALIGQVRRIAEGQRRELAALEPADDARADFEALLTAERRQLEVLTRLERDAVGARPKRFLGEVARTAAATDEALNAAADRLGALRCGSAGG